MNQSLNTRAGQELAYGTYQASRMVDQNSNYSAFNQMTIQSEHYSTPKNRKEFG